jgi:hypothetical protein
VGKLIERQDEPSVEATEIGYEARDQAQTENLLIVRSSLNKDAAQTRHGAARAPIAAVSVSGEDLDKAEIGVRSVLFHLGFGLGAEEIAPSVERTRNEIVVRGVISSDERREQLERALAAVPHAASQIADRVEVARGGARKCGGRRGRPGGCPPAAMRQQLIQRFGSEKTATAFSNGIVAGSGKIFALSVLYRDLATRYRRPKADALSAEHSQQLHALVRDIEKELQVNLKTESSSLNPIPGEISGPEINPGLIWQDRADRLFHLALTHDKIVSLLFAVTASNSPEMENSASNPDLLQRVYREMMSLVSP